MGVEEKLLHHGEKYNLPQNRVRLDSGSNFIGRTDCITFVT
jgi:hypothetical protein